MYGIRPWSFSPRPSYPRNLKSIRKALRDGELEKDTYERVTCTECGKSLKTENDPDTITTIRTCPDCGGKWKAIR